MFVKHAFRIGRVQYGPGTELGPRDTIGYEFVRVLKGHVRWEVARPGQSTEVHEVGPGAFILSHPGMVERYLWDQRGITQHDYTHFYLGEFPAGFPSVDAWPLVQQVHPHDVLHAQFQHIIDLHKSEHPAAIEMIKRAIEQMLYAWVHDLHFFEERGFKDFSRPVQRVLDLVHSRWRQALYKPPSLDQMVERSQVSRSTFLRAFKHECHASPSSFFEYQRVHLVHMHLLESNRNIEEIAHLLGYPNPFQLSRNFKHVFGLSPRNYREETPVDRPTPRLGTDGYLFQSVFEVLSATQTV